MRRLLTVASALALAGCAVQPTPELTPQPADLAAMNGYWIGEFTNAQTGKTGTMSLWVRSSTDSASGDVVLVPSRSTAVVAADFTTHSQHASAPEVLRIGFARVLGGMIEGTVEGYILPECSCVVTTVFQATPTRNRMAGEFVTSNARGFRQQGTWSVERQVVAADDVNR